MRIGAVAAVLAAAAMADGWIGLEGKPCPAFVAQSWLNTGGDAPSKASLRGKVILLFFFCESVKSADETGYLNWLHDKYDGRGLRVVALTADPPDAVEKLYVTQLKARYRIGCDREKITFGKFAQVGIPATMPHAYLVGADGTVTAHGERIPEEAIRDLVEELELELGREVHPALAAAAADYGKGDVGKAWAAAGKRTSDRDGAIAADAKLIVGKCEARADFTRRVAEKKVAAKDYPAALKVLSDLAQAYAGMGVASWAVERKRGLEADPDVRRELVAWQEFDKIAARERKAGNDAKKMEAVRREYRALIEGHPGTRASLAASERAGGA